MASTWRCSGVTGSIRYGYLSAATVQSWTVRPAADGQFTLSGTLTGADAFRLSQTPLRFVAPVQGGAWTWPVMQISVNGSACTATLGPLER